MASIYDGALEALIYEFGRLPGIGPKSAQRIAFYILGQPAEETQELIRALADVKERVHFCETCGNVTESTKCVICSDTRRVQDTICVVAQAKDIQAIEATREFRGLYHVLGGLLDPISGVDESALRVRELLARLYDGTVKEIILALDTSVNGHATALALARILAPTGIAVSRLAVGMQAGSEVNYVDEASLGFALEGRTPMPGTGTTASKPQQ